MRQPILFCPRFLFYSKYIRACADRVHQLALNDDERFLVLFFPVLCMVFYVQRQERKRKNEKEQEKIVSNGKEREKMVSCCYLMVNQQTTKTTQSHSR